MKLETYKGDLMRIVRELDLKDRYPFFLKRWMFRIMCASWGPFDKLKRLLCWRHEYWLYSARWEGEKVIRTYKCSKCGKYKIEEDRR